jgi:subtilase family serine protease
MRSKLTRFHRQRPLQFERLEERLALSASVGSFVETPTFTLTPTAAKKPVHSAVPIGLTPQQVRDAYGFNNVTFGSVVGDGSGQTIAIVDAFNAPNMMSDLATFDRTFGLPDPPSLHVIQQQKGKKLPKNDKGWSQEISLDVEWAHAIAPGANIVLIETVSAAELFNGVDYARRLPGVSVISLSAAATENKQEASIDSLFTTPYGHSNETFVVSSGDNGAKPQYPSSSPNVLSVGGTSLTLGWNGEWYRAGETVWSGSGGGRSQFEGLPSFQNGLGLATRGTPDVSYDGNPSTGFAVYDSYGLGGWGKFGGTSAGAPQWAALLAIVDQGRALGGKASLANAQAAMYDVPRGDFFDVTSGSNGTFATFGYDTATGLGSPIANLLIPDLAAYSGSADFSVAAIPAPVKLAKHGKAKAASLRASTVAVDDALSSAAFSATGSIAPTDSNAFTRAACDSIMLGELPNSRAMKSPVAGARVPDSVWAASTIPSSRPTLRPRLTATHAPPDSVSLTSVDAFFADLNSAV